MILLAPDSFKGSLSAAEVAQAMQAGLARVWPDVACQAFPMADGGEGTLDAILTATGANSLSLTVCGANFDEVSARYGLLDLPEGKTAVLEVAQVVGITMPLTVPVYARTTLGLGQMMRHLLDQGVRRFMVGLGGSSTNDGGSGLLAALGARFLDGAGHTLVPTPEGLESLAAVDFSGLDPRLAASEIIIMSDVNNPLCGELGATAIFGPQKGVEARRVAEVDGILYRYGQLCDADRGSAVSRHPGAGAAGGLGYAFQLLGGVFRTGADVVLDLQGFDEALEQATWIITGEGRSDEQTLLGKVPHTVANRAARRNVPVTLISGGVDHQTLHRLAPHFAGCFSIINRPMSLEEAIQDAARLIADCTEQVARVRASC